MKVALCTLVIGERFERLFQDYVLESWEHYCRAHGFSLHVFKKPFAELPGKSFAWQKLFLLKQEELRGFDKIIWLDSDIIIRRDAPALEAPSGYIGYVQESPFNGSVAGWYKLFSLPPADEIVQTGVLCLEPQHDSILQKALSFPETDMYEMPALSWCISSAHIGYRLDPRFNALLGTLMLNYAPRWIVTNKALKESLWLCHYPPLRRAVRDVCEKNWFIHAAGAKRDLAKAHRCLSKLEGWPAGSASESPTVR